MAIERIAAGVYLVKPNERKKWQGTNAGKYISIFTKNRMDQWELSLEASKEKLKNENDRYKLELESYLKLKEQLQRDFAALDRAELAGNAAAARAVFSEYHKNKRAEADRELREKQFSDRMKPEDRARLTDYRLREQNKLRELGKRFDTDPEQKKYLMPRPTTLEEYEKIYPEYAPGSLRAQIQQESGYFGPTPPPAVVAAAVEPVGVGETVPYEPTLEEIGDEAEAVGIENPSQEQINQIRQKLIDARTSSTTGAVDTRTVGRVRNVGQTPVSPFEGRTPNVEAMSLGPTEYDIDDYIESRGGDVNDLEAREAARLALGTSPAGVPAPPPPLPEKIPSPYASAQKARLRLAEQAAGMRAPTPPTLVDPIVAARGEMLSRFGGNVRGGSTFDFLMSAPPEMRDVLLKRAQEIQLKQEDQKRKEKPPQSSAVQQQKKEQESQVAYLGDLLKTAKPLVDDPTQLAKALGSAGGRLGQKMMTAGLASGMTTQDVYKQLTRDVQDPQQREDAQRVVIAYQMLQDKKNKPPSRQG